VKSWEILHQHVMDVPISPICCNVATVPSVSIKSFFSNIIHVFISKNKQIPCQGFKNAYICTANYFRYLRIKRTVTMNVNLPTTPEKCHRTTSWNAELIHLMEGILFPSRRCWLSKEPVVLCGNLNVRQATSQQLYEVATFCMVKAKFHYAS